MICCAGTTIPITLRASGYVELRVYNVAGRLVSSLVNKQLPAGPHKITWDDAVASGTYFYQLSVDGRTVGAKKAVLLK